MKKPFDKIATPGTAATPDAKPDRGPQHKGKGKGKNAAVRNMPVISARTHN